MHAEIDGEQLTDEKIYGFLRLLLPAGAETTFRVMGNALVALLTHPDAHGPRSSPTVSLLPAVIEETLRWETSVTQVSRVAATRHRDRRAARSRPGARDQRAHRLGQPRRSALRRTPRTSTSTARRRTTSPSAPASTSASGMHLARLELRVGLDAILDRLPNLRLDPDAPRAGDPGPRLPGPGRRSRSLFDPS